MIWPPRQQPKYLEGGGSTNPAELTLHDLLIRLSREQPNRVRGTRSATITTSPPLTHPYPPLPHRKTYTGTHTYTPPPPPPPQPPPSSVQTCNPSLLRSPACSPSGTLAPATRRISSDGARWWRWAGRPGLPTYPTLQRSDSTECTLALIKAM